MKQSAVNSRQSAVGSAGFSLIEIVITLVVLSIAAVGVLSVFSSTQRGSADPLLLNQAVQLAQEKMDEISGDRKNIARGFQYIVPGSYGPETPVPGPGFTNFNRTVTICCVTPPPPANALNNTAPCVAPGVGGCASGYTHVTVTVTNATIGSVSMDTVFANYGPF